MNATQGSTREMATFPFPAAENLTALCRAEGPCISIFLAPHRAGSGSRASNTDLRNLIPEIAGALYASGVHPQDAGEIIAPLEAMSDDPSLTGSHGETLCIFRSPRELHSFSVRATVEPGWHVEERFNVLPILAHLDYRKTFLLLALAAKHMRLLRYDNGELSAIPFPDGVPESESELARENGDDHTKNHASGVNFGSSQGKENKPHFLADFLKAIDRGLLPVYREQGLPLVLAGVDEERAAYAAISGYPLLVAEGVKLSPDGGISGAELGAAAAEVMRRWSTPAECQALLEFEKFGLGRRSTDPAAILKAGAGGQIQHLFVARGGHLTGDARWLGNLGAADGYVYRNEDLTNAAAVEVLLHKGMVWLLEPEQMPEAVVLAAVLRYAGDTNGE